MRRVTVYRSESKWAKQALQLLLEAGVDASFAHVPIPIVQERTLGTLKVEVTVPEAELPRARELLQEWERKGAERTQGVTSRLVLDLLLSFIPPAIVLSLAWAITGDREAAHHPLVEWSAFFAWLGSLFLIGRRQRSTMEH